MSSYGEKRDMDDERTRGDLKAMQDGFQSSSSSRRSGSTSKKKNTFVCFIPSDFGSSNSNCCSYKFIII